jgi:hypothetical protein
MSSLAWGAFGFFIFVVVAGTVSTTVAGIGLWRRVKALRAAGGAALDDLGLALATLERRTAALEHESSDVQHALRSLQRSLRRGRILLAAWREAHDTAAGWFAFLPRP